MVVWQSGELGREANSALTHRRLVVFFGWYFKVIKD
jgi:hypothetical protein